MPSSFLLARGTHQVCTERHVPAIPQVHTFSFGIWKARMWTTSNPAFLLLGLEKHWDQREDKEAYEATGTAVGMLQGRDAKRRE